MEENSKIGKKLTDNVKKSQNCEEIHWHPVSNIPVEEIYKDLPEVKRYHDNYEKFWLKEKIINRTGR